MTMLKKNKIFPFPETSAITWRENMVITSLRIRGRQRPRFQEATHRARRLMAIEGFDGHDWKNDC